MSDMHREMVRTLVEDLQKRGFQAIAAQEEENFPEPDNYLQMSTQNWYRPDVQARSSDDNRLFIYEVETEESLDDPQTRGKIEALAHAALKANGRFYLVVPEVLRDGAQRVLRDMHVERGEVIGISEGRVI